ncbi:MAG: response regulator [Magnetococcus sp. YQC-5]
MHQDTQTIYQINDLNDRILTVRDQLSGDTTPEMLASMIMAFFDLGSICEELKMDGFPEICENFQHIFSQVSVGTTPLDDFLKECTLMTFGLMYRSAINNEPCQREIEDLAVLIERVDLGDREGFQVTDYKMPDNEQDQITLFDDDEADADQEFTSTTTLNMLIVDDEPINQTLMRSILADHGTCDIASNGAEAVRLFMLAHENKTPYNVVFMDVMMPVLDGHLASEQIRVLEHKIGIEEKNETVIFMVTCLDSSDSVCKAFFHSYCTDYIIKPVRFNTIFNKMREYGLLK